jgi:ribosomal protein S27E
VTRIYCPQCRLFQPSTHVWCARCGGALPTELLRQQEPKSARFFPGIKLSDEDPEGAFLRVSCYRQEQTITSEQGSVVIPGHHVRFSVWVGEEARCVLSIPETEARDLADFIADELGPVDPAALDEPRAR